MSKDNELQEADVDISESMDDLSSFVDLMDLEGLDDATNQELFGDLGDISGLGDLPEESEKESDAGISIPDILADDLAAKEDLFASAEPEEVIPESDDSALEEPAADLLPDADGIDALLENAEDLPMDFDALGADGIDALLESDDEEMVNASDVLDDAAVLPEGVGEEAVDASDIPDAEDVLGADAIDALLESTQEELSADAEGAILSDMDAVAFDDVQSAADDSVLMEEAGGSVMPAAEEEVSADDALSDVMAALDAVSDNREEASTAEGQQSAEDGNIDSMLDGLLDNLDMNGSLEGASDAAAEAASEENEDDFLSMDDISDVLGMDDIPFASDGEEELGADHLNDMLDVAAMMPQSEQQEERKDGLLKRVFGNVVTDEIAEQERLEAEQAEEEAAKKAEEEEKEKEEREARKAEEEAKKAAQKEERKKLKAARKAEMKARRAEMKAQQEEEEAAELEVVGRLNKLGVSIIAIATVLFLTVEIAGTNLFGYMSTKKKAVDYFDMGKYTEAYQEAIGSDMRTKNPEEYSKIKVVMKVQQTLNVYQNYDRIGYYPEALDALLKGLGRYDANIDRAIELDVDKDMMSCRKQVLTLLEQEFQLSESEAYAIIALDKDAYQKKVVELGLKKR